MRGVALVISTLSLAGCAAFAAPPTIHVAPAGINQVLEGAIEAAPGHSLTMGDLNLSPNTRIPRHWHHGEEFIYVIGGSVSLLRAGEPDLILSPGQSFRIPPRMVHWGQAGPDGLRAVSSWVKPDNKPLREPAPE